MCNRTIDQSKAETREITMLIEIVQVRAHRLYIYIYVYNPFNENGVHKKKLPNSIKTKPIIDFFFGGSSKSFFIKDLIDVLVY